MDLRFARQEYAGEDFAGAGVIFGVTGGVTEAVLRRLSADTFRFSSASSSFEAKEMLLDLLRMDVALNADKTLDIGLSSRALKDDEKNDVDGTTVALDGIAIVVNKASKVADLTVDQLKQMFTGEITNWSEVGGDDGEIVLIGREAGSGTRDGFESIVDVKDSCKYAQELTATGAVISAVEANPLAIGYASLSAVGDTVKMVTVGGVECSEETVKDGSYEVQRPFVFVTNKSVTLSEQAQAFFDFATSADAADLIRTAGAVPVNE